MNNCSTCYYFKLFYLKDDNRHDIDVFQASNLGRCTNSESDKFAHVIGTDRSCNKHVLRGDL